MRIILIQSRYLPMISPRAFRWGSIAEAWVRDGHQVDVVCQWQPGLPRREEIDGVRVHRAGLGLRQGLNRFSAKQPGTEEAGAAGADAGTIAARGKRLALSLYRGIQPAYRRSWGRLYWPDADCTWFTPALREASALLRRHRFDGMVTSAFPFTCHLVGAAIRRRHPGLPWVADMGDPFSFATGATPNNDRLYRRLNHRAEEHVIASCDHYAVTNPEVLEEYRRHFPHLRGRLVHVPPIADLASLPPVEREIHSDGTIRLLYAGVFYEDIRPAEPMARLFDELLRARPDLAERLELHIFCTVTDFVRRAFATLDPYPGLVHLHGRQPRSVIHEWLGRADVLVNVGNTTPFQLPSKVVEYAATGKPVLNLTMQERDSSRKYFEGYPLALSLGVETISRPSLRSTRSTALADFLLDSPGKRIPQDAVLRFISPNLVENVADQVKVLLEARAGAR